ncbi:c6 transcription factor [Colletotrichum incanum]|uniref:C6 transcription factor n=1 Tax=Colletotrichum incanum TaxID=1573173 RepID=A0A161X3I6_COLIC|nr:c6 transcription factor [Colletotrichum incanum]
MASTTSSPSRSTESPQPERPRAPSVARWGAACAQCAAAKAKCLRSNETPGSKCDRSGTQAKEEETKPAFSSSSIRPTPLVPNHSFTLPLGHPGPDLYTQTRVSPCSAADLTDVGPIKIPESYNSFVPPTCICRPEPGEAPPPPDTDENLLKIYRTEMAPRFPFVLVPEGVSAATLGATRPFLMAAIRMVSSFRSMKSMRGQMYRLLNHIADYMLLRAERSFDLLLGLIVIIAWFHHHCITHAQLDQLMSLAACLVGELGLKRNPGLPERTRLLVMRPWEMRERTNEERRVLLAVWYLSSSIAMDIHQIDPLRYSVYMQQCLRELEENREYESDMHLIYIVKIQRLCERVADLRSNYYGDEEVDCVTRAPVSAYMFGFSSELNKLQIEMPPTYLKLRMATARLRIHEPPNINAELLASLSKSLDSFSAGSTSALDAFYQSNAALKAWFDTWLAVPKDSFCGMTLCTASHMVYAVMMLSRWAWLASRGSVPSTLQAEPIDPSHDNPNVALAAIEAAISPNTPASSSSPSAASKGNSPWQTTLPDKNLPQVLAALRAKLSSQPGLMLEVDDYLNKVVIQLQAIDAAFQRMSIDDGEWHGSIWSLGATKVKIAQLRQERWSKMVAAQAEVGELVGQMEAGYEGVGPVEMQENFMASLQMPEWDANMVWDPSAYYEPMSGDQQFWPDVNPGEQDWVSAGIGGMGSLGHLPGRYI